VLDKRPAGRPVCIDGSDCDLSIIIYRKIKVVLHINIFSGSDGIKKNLKKGLSLLLGLKPAKMRCDDYFRGKVHVDVNPGSIPHTKKCFRSTGDVKITNDKNPILHCGCMGQLLFYNSSRLAAVRVSQASEDKSEANG
jgi:hypothetical protein